MNGFSELIASYRTKGVLIDSNLVLLLVIGRIERNLVARFKRTRQFSVEDFDVLTGIASVFSRVVVTPHILAEVSNLATELHGRTRAAFLSHFARMIEVVDERHVTGVATSQDSFFGRLGVTDTAIILATTRSFLVLTVDATLASCIAARDGDVINFNHLRSANW